MNKKIRISLSLLFLLSFFKVSGFALTTASSFGDLRLQIGNPNFEISLPSGDIYKWTQTLILNYSGILRGRTGDNRFSVFEADHIPYQAFSVARQSIEFVGGFTFRNFFSAIYATNRADIKFTDARVNFTSNTASQGAVIYGVDNAKVKSTNSIITSTNNRANDEGTYLLFENSTAVFADNKAGGAIFAVNSMITFFASAKYRRGYCFGRLDAFV